MKCESNVNGGLFHSKSPLEMVQSYTSNLILPNDGGVR